MEVGVKLAVQLFNEGVQVGLGLVDGLEIGLFGGGGTLLGD